jgi:predicted anti-sigma-YlaC factor YlaD
VTAGCTEVRELAAELALGVLAGEERAEALRHLDGCSACRRLVDDLAGAADRLLAAAPPVEPPAGFESRVAERLAAAGPSAPAVDRRRLPRMVAVAAALVAVVGSFVVGARLGDDGAGGVRGDRRLALVAGEREVGEILLVAETGDRGARVVCVLETARSGLAYRLRVVGHDGSELASWAVAPGPERPWSWTGPLPVDPDQVARVEVTGPAGEPWASTSTA